MEQIPIKVLSDQEQLDAQIKIVKQQAKQLYDINKSVWGDFRERLLRGVAKNKQANVIAFWNLY